MTVAKDGALVAFWSQTACDQCAECKQCKILRRCFCC